MIGVKSMKTVCKLNACAGCMACVDRCRKHAIMIKDDISAYNAVIDEKRCVSCGACEKICPNNQSVQLCHPIAWKEGWAKESNIREKASSGGAAFSLMMSFIDRGGYVAACLFRNGNFIFDITNEKADLKKFSGSKYVKSNPTGIYEKVSDRLKNGDSVLFIGLPCQVAALLNFTKGLSHENQRSLYTVDLICHGTPSPQILNLALSEKGIDIQKLIEIRFREKTNFGLASRDKINEYNSLALEGIQDMYTYAFLTALDYTENCYACNYAKLERVSDVTIGDSWGSNLPIEEQKKGVSILLCQTEKGEKLVQNSEMVLRDADLEMALRANHQLQHPSIMPKERAFFFSNLEGGFYKAVSKSVPRVYYRRRIKEFLIKYKLMRRFI